MFINTVAKVISSNFHLYADDLQLYRHFKLSEVGRAIDAVNRDLDGIDKWAKSFGLQVNPLKSQAMIIGSRYFRSALDISTLEPVRLNGTVIPFTDTAKNLGVIFDSNLLWGAQVSEVSRRVHFSFHSLKRLRSFLPFKTKILLVQSLIQPLLDYADACYLDVTEELLNKLERLQNVCIRFVFDLKKYDHVSVYRSKLKWLPIRLRRNTRILCLLYNVLNNPAYPIYLRDRFSLARPPEALSRSHLKSLLEIVQHKTDFYSYSFTVHAVRLWNSLPPSIRDSKSISIFKRLVRDYYLSS